MSASATLVMKLTGPSGPLDGECQVEGYEKYIELESWSWSVKDGKTSIEPQHFNFSKLTDRASMTMLAWMEDSLVLPSAVILVEEDSSDSKLELKLTLKKIRIEDFKLNGKVDDKSGAFSEDWTVSFAEAVLQYTSYGAKGEKSRTVTFTVDGGPWDDQSAPTNVKEELKTLFAKLPKDERASFADELKKLKDEDLVKPKNGRLAATDVSKQDGKV